MLIVYNDFNKGKPKTFQQSRYHINNYIMKKSLKKLSLNKQMISTLKLSKVKGGHSGCCPTDGALNSCPPQGMQCF